MTGILPSLREKKRYLVFEVVGNANCSDAVAGVKDSFASVFGVSESANAGISALKSSGNRCLVSVNRKCVDRLRASLAMVARINDEKVILRSVGVSGMLNKAAERYMRC